MQGSIELVETSGPLVAWASQALSGVLNQSVSELTLIPLAGDAGLRAYYRIKEHPEFLLVSAPGQGECVRTFANIAQAFQTHNVAVPKVYALDDDRNTMLIQDFGNVHYADKLNPESVDTLYSEAIMTLLRIQQVSKQDIALPSYDQALLRQEMELFRQWFVNNLLHHTLNDHEHRLIDEAFAVLEKAALSQPSVCVHRDYHSRNLMYRSSSAPGVIDFQDAVWGPVTYDLVSLLRDCYVRWPPEQVKRWALTYANLAMELKLMPEVNEATFMYWFDTMGLQRHIKVLGIFARLALRDNKTDYLQDLPLVVRYVLDHADQHSEFAPLSHWFKQTLIPLIEAAPWYRDIAQAEGRYALLGTPA